MSATEPTVEMLFIGDLTPYEYNSRTHSEEQIQQIAVSIRQFGFTNPVLIDDQLQIIAGHGRVEAAKLIGMSRIPCIRLSHLDDAQRRAYVIADNKLAENAGWEYALLRVELQDLKIEGIDLSVLGFSDEELENLLNGMPGEGAGDGGDEKEEFTLTIKSHDEVEIEAIRQLLKLRKNASSVDAERILTAIQR